MIVSEKMSSARVFVRTAAAAAAAAVTEPPEKRRPAAAARPMAPTGLGRRGAPARALVIYNKLHSSRVSLSAAASPVYIQEDRTGSHCRRRETFTLRYRV